MRPASTDTAGGGATLWLPESSGVSVESSGASVWDVSVESSDADPEDGSSPTSARSRAGTSAAALKTIQQLTLPDSLSAQTWSPPALSAVCRPLGGCCCPSNV